MVHLCSPDKCCCVKPVKYLLGWRIAYEDHLVNYDMKRNQPEPHWELKSSRQWILKLFKSLYLWSMIFPLSTVSQNIAELVFLFEATEKVPHNYSWTLFVTQPALSCSLLYREDQVVQQASGRRFMFFQLELKIKDLKDILNLVRFSQQ